MGPFETEFIIRSIEWGSALLRLTFYRELFSRILKIDKDEVDSVKNGNCGSRTMYLKGNSLFFIKTVTCLMRNHKCWKNNFSNRCCMSGEQQKYTISSLRDECLWVRLCEI